MFGQIDILENQNQIFYYIKGPFFIEGEKGACLMAFFPGWMGARSKQNIFCTIEQNKIVFQEKKKLAFSLFFGLWSGLGKRRLLNKLTKILLKKSGAKMLIKIQRKF